MPASSPVAASAAKKAEAGGPPRLECSACQTLIELGERRVGDSLRCPNCDAFQVVTRSRTRGEVPAAGRTGALNGEERQEVAEVLRRIKLRRMGKATRHQELYPSWAVFVAGVQFYLSGILAGQNLEALGDARGGRRLRVLGIVSYLVVGALMLASAYFLGERIPLQVGVPVLLSVPLLFACYFTWRQHSACAAAREAGAPSAPVLLPLLLGMILAIAQGFAVWFVQIRLEGPV